MDTTDLKPLVQQLSTNISHVEKSLAPLLNTAIAVSTSKLPLLDKAKLYTNVTYAIESLLFSYLRLNGVEAKSHPVFQELARVKQYFDKIKLAENPPAPRNASLDKTAAGRFIKAGLSGNDKYDKERAEQQSKEKAGAKRKFEDMTERVGSHTRFEAMSRNMEADEAQNLVAEAETDDSTSKKRSRKETDGSLPRKSKSSKAPRGHNEAFQALLQGPLPDKEETKTKKKRKSKGGKQQD